jgi:hypothetical protein
LRDLAALGKALDACPQLSDAFHGHDGGRPIGKVAAVSVSRVASPESVGAWVDLARRLPIKRFKNEARRAREAGSDQPLDLERAFSTDDELWRSRDDQGLGRVRVGTPRPVRFAWDASFELHRAVCGGEPGVIAFADGLIGEAYAGLHAPRTDVFQLPNTRNWDALEALLFWNTAQWSHLGYEPSDDGALAVLAEAAELFEKVDTGGPEALCRRLEQLIELEDRLEKELGRILALIGHEGGWSKLGFAGLGHYAEQRLGISRTTAHDRARLYRVLWRFPLLQRAYEEGRVGSEAALLVLRVLPANDEDLERQWVQRAEQATLKRLRDEVKMVRGKKRKPLTDEEWSKSRRLAPGDIRKKVKALGLEAMSCDGPMETLELNLPADQAVKFMAAVEGWRKALEKGKVREDMAAARVARSFSERSLPVPQWVGLLAMLEDFAETWDNPEGVPKRKADKIYVRDGWRCSAPGCTSRKNLQSHHLEYRSRGGDEKAEWNQVCVCRFHHQMGEHGAFAQCRGRAPLEVVWRLGREELGSWYRNEMKIEGPRS